jgi:hypothetical protein
MAFEIVSSKGRQTGRSYSTKSEVSFYGKTAQFRLTPVAFANLGSPDKVEVLYDKATGEMGLRASDAAHAVTLRKDSPTAQSRYFGFRAFAEMVGLAEDARIVMELSAPNADGIATAALPTASA